MKTHAKRREPVTLGEVQNLFTKYYPRAKVGVPAKIRLVELLSNIPALHQRDMEGDIALRERRATIAAFDRLIESQRLLVQQIRNEESQFERSGSRATAFADNWLANLAELKKSLEAAHGPLLWPVAFRRHSRTQSVWHRSAFKIAMTLRGILRVESPSLDKRGPFVNFVAAALSLSFGRNFTANAVEAALRRPTWPGQIAQPPLYGRASRCQGA